MTSRVVGFLLVIMLVVGAAGCAHRAAQEARGLHTPDDSRFTPEQAAFFHEMAEGALAPVYPLLAEQIVAEFDLAERPAVGIDLGGGPGTLVVELCKRTRNTYWVNADINPHNFAYFYRTLDETGLGHRAGAVFADAHALPFRDGYADIVVSRGTYPFWEDQPRAFGEVLRVLKPGGAAFIGRGLPDALTPAQARAIREQHGSGPKYDVEESVLELRTLMAGLGVRDYAVRTYQHPEAPDVNYGLWLVFRK